MQENIQLPLKNVGVTNSDATRTTRVLGMPTSAVTHDYSGCLSKNKTHVNKITNQIVSKQQRLFLSREYLIHRQPT